MIYQALLGLLGSRKTSAKCLYKREPPGVQKSRLAPLLGLPPPKDLRIASSPPLPVGPPEHQKQVQSHQLITSPYRTSSATRRARRGRPESPPKAQTDQQRGTTANMTILIRI